MGIILHKIPNRLFRENNTGLHRQKLSEIIIRAFIEK
jgi:hypothetical protein